MSDPAPLWYALRDDGSEELLFLVIDENGGVDWTRNSAWAERFKSCAEALYVIDHLAPGLAAPCQYIRG